MLAQELNDYIQAMHDQGILDYNFDHMKSSQDEDNPQFIMEVISLFTHDADNAIAQITNYLNAPVVDFPKLTHRCHKLKGSSSGLGGHRMAMACANLRNASEDRNKERCLENFEMVKQEYNSLRNCLNNISLMERNIIVQETRSH